MNKSILYLLIGLSGSGKSHWAKENSEKLSAKIISTDSIREELLGSEEDQSQNDQVFNLAHSRILEELKMGRNAIFDATNLSPKYRKVIIQKAKNIGSLIHGIVFATPVKECLINNSRRERKVPEYVIYKQINGFWYPAPWEGFDKTETIFPKNSLRTNLPDILAQMKDVNQENPNHSLTLDKHCEAAADYLMNKDNPLGGEIWLPTLLHDYGKLFTKKFKNYKGEETEIAHYFGHHNRGAYELMFLRGFKAEDILLVNYHMQPYFWKKPETFKKYRSLWGDDFFNKIMLLHEADRAAH